MTTGEKTVDRGSIMAAGRREDVPPHAHGPLDVVWRVWRKRARNPTENEIERNGGGATLRHDRAKPAFDSGRNELDAAADSLADSISDAICCPAAAGNGDLPKRRNWLFR